GRWRRRLGRDSRPLVAAAARHDFVVSRLAAHSAPRQSQRLCGGRAVPVSRGRFYSHFLGDAVSLLELFDSSRLGRLGSAPDFRPGGVGYVRAAARISSLATSAPLAGSLANRRASGELRGPPPEIIMA